MTIDKQTFWNYSKKKLLDAFVWFRFKVKYHKNFKNIRNRPKFKKLFYKRTPKQIVTCFVYILLVLTSLKSTMETVEHCMEYVKNKDTEMTSITLLVTLNRFRSLRVFIFDLE